MSHDVITDPIKLRMRYDSLKSARKTVEGQWQEIERYIIPYRGEFFTDYSSEHQVRWNRHEIFDSTALSSAQRLAGIVQSGITNPLVKWFDLSFRDKNLNTGPAKEWLEDTSNRIWMALQESNFGLESNEAYLDMVTMGTSIIVEEVVNDDEWEGVDFQATGLRDSYFEEDHKGQVLRYYRRLEWKLAQIIDKFGEDKLPEELKRRAGGTADIDQKIELFQVIYPRVKRAKDVEFSTPLAPAKRPWGMMYVLHQSGEQIGDEGGYYEMPVFVARWGKVSGSQWGHGPAAIAMPDVKTLNELVQLDLRAREKAIDPALAVTERGLIGDLDLGPGGLTVVRSMDDWKIIESGARFDATNDKMQQLQENIRNLFHIPDFFLKESPAMTATEVLERREQINRFMAATSERIQNDFLDPTIQRTFNVMQRAGQLAAPPEELQNVDMDIEYLGPLARSMRNERVQAIDTWLMMMERYAAIDPTITYNVDPDELARELSVMMGVPQTIVVDEDAVTKRRAEEAEQAKMMQEGQMGQEVGAGMEAMGKGGQALQAVGGQGGQ